MQTLRAILGYLCCVILLWMNVAAGLFLPAMTMAHAAAPVAMHGGAVPGAVIGPNGGGGDLDHGHNVAVSHGHGVHASASETPPAKAAQCLAECLDRVADKLPPHVSAFDFSFELTWVAIAWRPYEIGPLQLRPGIAGNWPTGPPDPGPWFGSGSERIVALNGRLRL